MFFRADFFFFSHGPQGLVLHVPSPQNPLLERDDRDPHSTLHFCPGVNSPMPTSLPPHLLGTNGSSECSDLMSCAGIQKSWTFLWPGLIQSTPVLLSRKTYQRCHFSSHLSVWARHAIHRCLTRSGVMKNDIRALCGQPHVNLLLTVYSDQNRRACFNSWCLHYTKKRCTLNKKGLWNDNCFNGVTPNLSCYKTQINGAPVKCKSPSQKH